MMENEEEKTPPENPTEVNEYLKTIAELKKNTVPREKYDAVREENRQLLQSIVEGKDVESEEEQKPADIAALRKELFSEDNHMDNLAYAQKALELRDALMEAGESDPFLPTGYKITADNLDVVGAQKVADTLQECIEYAKGDADVFTNELQRRLIDTAPMYKRK